MPRRRKDDDTKRELDKILHVEREILHELQAHDHVFPTHITFGEITMLPTEAGNTLIFTGTLAPAGATFPSDTVFTVESNDPAVVPTVDATGLIVTIPLPSGWTESTTVPLSINYSATSASTSGVLNAVITPSAPPAEFPTGITFVQTS